MEIAGDPRPLLLLRVQGGRAGPSPLGFQPPHHPQEGELDPRHLLGLADAVDRGGEEGPGAGEVDLLHRLDQILERLQSPPLPRQGKDQRQNHETEPDHQQGHGPSLGVSPGPVEGFHL